MGDRVSISFYDGFRESVAFFSHWDGMSLVEIAEEYVKNILGNYKFDNSISTPLSRREADTVMVDFITWYIKRDGPIEGNYYLGKDEFCGDNSDNGHHIISTVGM